LIQIILLFPSQKGKFLSIIKLQPLLNKKGGKQENEEKESKFIVKKMKSGRKTTIINIQQKTIQNYLIKIIQIIKKE